MPAPTPVLLGYADRFSVRPGETIRFMVSCEADRFSTELFRLIYGDEHADGPGFRRVRVPSSADGAYPGRRQVIGAGSYVRIPIAEGRELERGLAIQTWIWPTLPTKPGGQALAAWWSADRQCGFVLGLDDDARLCLDLGFDGTTHRVTHPRPLHRWQWASVAASYDATTGDVRLYVDGVAHAEQLPAASGLTLPAGDILLAAREVDALGQPHTVFNGKLDRPRVFERALSDEEVERCRLDPTALADAALAAWDFSSDIDTSTVRDASGNELHGQTVNMPTRGVTDHTWSGDVMRWSERPEQYVAIHFHDDDLEDAGWEPSFELTLPETLRSGVYAMHLQAEGGEEEIPFFVPPPRGQATAPVAFVVPTLTYIAYANERLFWNEGYLEKRPKMTPLQTRPPEVDQYMAEHRELGLSMYDVHNDGSGVCYSSRLRPILNMRPRYRMWRLSEAPRHLAADLYLIGWLESRLIPYNVITDEDVHAEGSELLGRYRVLLTGSHPEYLTSTMHHAYRRYLANGGRLMYLGGNGFYWVTSIDASRPHVIEIRRGTTGTRTWETLPGEQYHSTSGEFGGLWRLRGWDPRRLVGVGFASQGWGGAEGYARLPDSHDPRAAFIFEGIGDDEVIGDFGYVLGGAAGDEVDRFDPRFGSPPDALLLATSAGRHSDYYQVTVEDVTAMVPGQGGRESPLVRADMVYFETANGGAVFSVGSINWLGALAWNGYQNNVARITENVLRRFMQ